ncbi:hypothetical protein ACFUMH_10720 [Cellulomonas sp. NPDC057328]|uniref:hypothetical protein n=1 Tax=Cellulomonas sp. NPDC057328 TaxID=3346101 RepID=UPI003629B6C9
MTGAGAGRAGTLVVDAANVVGARPDGWWKDRAGAAARLLGALAASVDADAWDGRRVVVVLEGAARAAVKSSGHQASTTLHPAPVDQAVHHSGHAGATTPHGSPDDEPLQRPGRPGPTAGQPVPDDEGVQRSSRQAGRTLHTTPTRGWPGVDVVLAERDGDSAIVEVVAAAEDDVVVVTSDRELRRRVKALGADVRGAGWLRDVLDTLTP